MPVIRFTLRAGDAMMCVDNQECGDIVEVEDARDLEDFLTANNITVKLPLAGVISAASVALALNAVEVSFPCEFDDPS